MFLNNKWVGLLLLLVSSCCFALDTDSKQEIHIVADSGSYNFKTGVNVFQGNVKVDQGTTHITADKLITKRNKQHKIKEALAYGISNRAHYWTQPKINDPIIHARAYVIKYYPLTSNATLMKNVWLQQGENSFKGELIRYNSEAETIIVPPTEKSHALIIYKPES